MTAEELMSGNWWLVRAIYPVACDASINEVFESDEDPLNEVDYANELREECVNSFGYLDDFNYDEDSYDSEEEQYDMWYRDQLYAISLESISNEDSILIPNPSPSCARANKICSVPI